MNLTGNNRKIPLYRRITEYLRQGYQSLDDVSQKEVTAFVKSCQHPEGGFRGRDERQDAYYSIFGNWMYAALGLSDADNSQLTGIKNRGAGGIDILSSILISVLQQKKNYKKPSVIKLLWLTFGKTRQISIYYRFFLFVLICDALYKGRFLKFAGRTILPFFQLPAGSPCSLHAAMLVARNEVSLGTGGQQNALLSFFEEGRGFKSFNNIRTPDLLSTATALFALKNSGTDLRILAPACLEFIQENYLSGAFLAGNGDEVRDMEYTFYGLLALGTLV